MNCTDINTQMDDYLDDRLEPQARSAFDQHVAGCKACAAMLEQMQGLLHGLQQLPISEPSADFEQRVFNEIRRQHRQPRVGRFAAGFATAMAASLAIWFASSVYLPEMPGQSASQQATVSVALNQQQTVRLMFEAQSDIQQVSLSIDLPNNMQLAGYPGRKQLSWQTSLKKGSNVLALPVMAVDPGEGELVARLNYGDKSKTVRVLLKTMDDGVLRYQLRTNKSA